MVVMRVDFWTSVGLFFFFKQKTAYEMRISDWSSDVCSSDLVAGFYFARNSPPDGNRTGLSAFSEVEVDCGSSRWLPAIGSLPAVAGIAASILLPYASGQIFRRAAVILEFLTQAGGHAAD